MGSMEEFKKFLHQFRCEKGQTFTHTSISNPAGSYNIPEEQTESFYKLYKRVMLSGGALHFTEKPTPISCMRTDLDFRFQMPELKPEADRPLSRMYLPEDVQRIVHSYFTTMQPYLKADPDKWIAVVMEKTKPSEYRNRMKDGIHIIWPYLVVDNHFQHWTRKMILDKGSQVFAGLPLTNTFEDVVDKAIIDRNNWQMYGSCKPDCETYRITKIFKYDPETDEIMDLSNIITPEFELNAVELLSMRNKPERVSIHDGKQKDIDEYVKFVLPSMEERRKTTLHSQVFGKSMCLMENMAPKEELELAKDLITKCLNPSRADNYEDWIKLGWALRNIDHRLLDTWVEFSRVSTKYSEGECNKLWKHMRIDNLGMGTLRWWAKTDNSAEYERILSDNVISLVDMCIQSNGAHFDVARVVHALYKDAYRFTFKDTWYTFKPERHRWVRNREGLQLRLILSNEVCRKFMERSLYWNNEALRNMEQRTTYDERSKKLIDVAKNLKQSGYKDSIMKECKCLFTDEKFEEMLDSNPHLIGFENGVYDLRMHEFRDGLPDDYISFSTSRYYRPHDPESQDAKEIETFLSQVFTTPSVKAYMKDVMACILDGGIRQEKFYMFTGSGSNGKSKILELVQKAIGEYYCILPIALLTQKRAASNSAQSELERTKGRRFAVMQEPGENEKINIGLMKELSGGDRILARGLYKEPIEFRPQFKMILTCNELPEVGSDDGGTWRRIRVIEFTSKFVESPNPAKPHEFPIDLELSDKFDKWADGFIAMLIDHHKKFDPMKIAEPMEVRIATEGYKKNNDLIGQFVTEKLVRDPTCTKRLMVGNAYTDFKSWAFQSTQKGKKIPDRNQFRAYMEKTFGAYPADGKGWKQIRVISQSGDDDSEAED